MTLTLPDNPTLQRVIRWSVHSLGRFTLDHAQALLRAHPEQVENWLTPIPRNAGSQLIGTPGVTPKLIA